MTIQIKSGLFISDKKYDVLVGVVDGQFNNIFNIMDLNLNLGKGINSACLQGYKGNYIVTDDRFKLNELQVDLENEDTLINGVKAIKQKTIVEYFANKYANDSNRDKKEYHCDDLTGLSFFNSRFENLNIDISFTGDIILGYGVGERKEFHISDCLDGWIDAYKDIMKLTVKDGEVISLKNINTEDIYAIKKEERRIHEEAMRLLREEELA